MAGIKKLVQKMKNQPHGTVLEEADRVLRHYGYNCKRMEGSHRQYVNAEGGVIKPLAKLHKFRKRFCRFASHGLAKRRFKRKLLQN